MTLQSNPLVVPTALHSLDYQHVGARCIEPETAPTRTDLMAVWIARFGGPPHHEQGALQRHCGNPTCVNTSHFFFFTPNQETPMAQLEDLKESISDLDDDALLARLSELRSNRRSGGATAKPTPAKQAMSMEAMKALIAGMSAEERAAFMETLS